MAEFDRLAPGDGAAWERQFNAFMANADLSFGILSTELWSTRRALARPQGVPPARPPRAARVRRQHARQLPRLGLDDVRVRGRPRRPRALGAAHRPRPDQATSGFMTQVIGAALQLGGMPVPVGGGVRLVDALAGIVSDAGGEVRLESDVQQILVANGPRDRRAARRRRGRRRHPGGRRERDADAALRVAPRRLRRAARRRRGCGAVPLRPRGDADPPRARRAAPLEGPRRRAPRALPDRPRHARSRRRLAGRQRGRARAAPRRGDDRLRPARRARPVPRAGRQVDHLDPAAGAAGGARQGRRCRRARHRRRHLDARSYARRMPTASWPASATRSRTSAPRR